MRTILAALPGFPVHLSWKITIAIACMLAASGPLCFGGPPDQTANVQPQSSGPWQDSQVLQPAQLAASLSADKGPKPLVICVGFHILYEGGHIVNAKFAGPASKPEGIRKLEHVVQGLPKDKEIVLYCGCCPWERCPNIRPAFHALQTLDFTNVKVLSIPTNFHEDWVAKGYPFEKGPGKK